MCNLVHSTQMTNQSCELKLQKVEEKRKSTCTSLESWKEKTPVVSATIKIHTIIDKVLNKMENPQMCKQNEQKCVFPSDVCQSVLTSVHYIHMNSSLSRVM